MHKVLVNHLVKLAQAPGILTTCFMLNSTEHNISTAHKTKIPTNEDFLALSCWHFNIYEQDKFRAQLSRVWIKFYNLRTLKKCG